MIVGIRLYVLVGLLLLAAWGAQAGEEACAADRVDAWARVTYVFDGDTVKLHDGSKVRLVGLDTPEMGRDGKPSEAYAVEARDTLQRLLGRRERVGLRYDAERQDHHGRRLAHLFLDDGTNIQRALLEAGLATAVVFPPNLWQQRCYTDAETRARKASRRLWGLPSFKPIDAAYLPRDSRGYRVVTGRVRRIGESRNSLWLDLAGGVSLRIDKRDFEHFQSLEVRALRGKRLEARGVIKVRRGRLQMPIRHPSALAVLP